MKRNKYEIDMCNGTIMDKLISFSLPLMLTSILQLMFNAVDIIVVGRFSGSDALAAVGSTTALINIFTNLFIGISLGANVLAARYYAAGRDKEMSESVHTAIALALVSGIIMAFVGFAMSRFALSLMDTPGNVIGQSTTYMRIYFLGMPFFMLYNYGAAILRAVGDTKRPLMFLCVAGLANVVLDLLLVIVIPLDVAGVAIGTVASQMVSSILVLRCLHRTEGSYQVGDIRLAWYNGSHQPWKCRQEHDTTTYPDITPDGSAWRTFWIPFHGTTPETAQDWISPSGAHDQYEAGEYMVWTDGNTYLCNQATVYTPEEYAQAWELYSE